MTVYHSSDCAIIKSRLSLLTVVLLIEFLQGPTVIKASKLQSDVEWLEKENSVLFNDLQTKVKEVKRWLQALLQCNPCCLIAWWCRHVHPTPTNGGRPASTPALMLLQACRFWKLRVSSKSCMGSVS